MLYKPTRKGYPIKIVLNRSEIEQAMVCYLEKQGVSVTTFSVKIGTGEATITLNPGTEDATEAEPEMKAEVQPPVDDTAEAEEAFPTPADSSMFGAS